MAINETYSYKSLKHRSFVGVDTSEFNNTEIVGSSFSQEGLYFEDSGSMHGSSHRNRMKQVFPPDMTGVTFTRCVLDNVIIPPGNTVGERCVHREIGTMNDGDDWILDKVTHKPVTPKGSAKSYEAYGVSMDPADIPSVKREGRSALQDGHEANREARQ